MSQVVRMFIAVVSIFGICWLPYQAFYVYSFHNPAITSMTYVPHLYLIFYWLAMSNSMVNPLIYYWMNRKFRHYFQEAMCCFHLWKATTIHKTQDLFLQHHSLSIDRRKSCTLKIIILRVLTNWLNCLSLTVRQNNLLDSKSVRQTDINNQSPKA